MLNTRDRLLEVAAKIFVEKGFAKATTREICLSAETNITAIHYYFTNKSGLYRAIFSEAFKNLPKPLIEPLELFNKPKHEALVLFYMILLEPFLNKMHPFGEHHPDGNKLHNLVHELVKREQFEPTGLADDLIFAPAQFIHEPLNALLCHYLHLDTSDDELQRLAFALVSLGFSLIHPRHIVLYCAPNLLQQEGWKQLMFERLAEFAETLIAAEIQRRK